MTIRNVEAVQEKTIRFILDGHQEPRSRVELFIIVHAGWRRWRVERDEDGSILVTGRYLAVERFAARLIDQLNPVTGDLEQREAA